MAATAGDSSTIKAHLWRETLRTLRTIATALHIDSTTSDRVLIDTLRKFSLIHPERAGALKAVAGLIVNGQDRRNFLALATPRLASPSQKNNRPLVGLKITGELTRAIDRVSTAADLLWSDTPTANNLTGALIFATEAAVYLGAWQRQRREVLRKARNTGASGGQASGVTRKQKAACKKREALASGLTKAGRPYEFEEG
jgi:hypothetical protein